ncbi:hypothetical protein GW17_00012345 [Ensete ventricosum]|nr:hypothetical protein GW17_00012345 [Ensete ventricosum]RZS14089.1 hypothetical protein BHM03_00045756 [Ensete ventricosum]
MMITVTNRRKSGDETVMSSISLSASRFRTLAFLRSPAGNCIRSPRAHGAPYEPRHGGEASRRPESPSNRRPMVQGMVRRLIPPPSSFLFLKSLVFLALIGFLVLCGSARRGCDGREVLAFEVGYGYVSVVIGVWLSSCKD